MITTSTQQQTVKVPRQRSFRRSERPATQRGTRAHAAGFLIVGVVFLLGAVAAVWFALASGGEASAPKAPDHSYMKHPGGQPGRTDPTGLPAPQQEACRPYVPCMR